MDQINVALALMAGVVVLVGLLSNPIKGSVLQEPIIATAVGIAAGPVALGWLDVAAWGEKNGIVEEAARITLAIGLMGVAMRLRKESIRRLLRPVVLLITLGMVAMWAVSSFLGGWLLGLSLWTALLIGAVITPTDPVVASSIVTGRLAKEKLPLRLRDTISFDAGANDGLAYAFVMLAVAMLAEPPGAAWTEWLTRHVLIGIVGGAAIGAAIGYAAARALKWAEERDYVEGSSMLGYTIALSLMTLGFAKLLGADAIVSVFVAGLVFNLATERMEEAQEKHIQEAVAKLFTLPMFVLFGLVLPWHEWNALGWPLAAFVILVLLLRRPLPVLLLFPLLRRHLGPADSAYLGWFGPIGIAAIFYAASAERHTGDALFFHVASAAVFASILVHGVTAAALTRLYGSTAHPDPPATRGLDAADRRDENEGEASAAKAA